MKVPGGGFDQCYNAQAVVAANMVQASNDNSQLEPMLARHADAGYFSAANVAACDAALIAMGRQPHHCTPAECFAPAPPAPENPTPVAAMVHWLKTPEGKSFRRFASRCRNRCSASSNPCSDSANSSCAASPKYEANGAP